jgi:hypothetical protein
MRKRTKGLGRAMDPEALFMHPLDQTLRPENPMRKHSISGRTTEPHILFGWDGTPSSGYLVEPQRAY